jgi:RND family efflux transporter MFP subunit
VATAAGLAVGCRPTLQPPPAPPPPAVTVARPGTAQVQDYYEYNGYLEATETVEVRARVKGYLESVLYAEGEEVRAGEALYKIDPREFQSAVAKAEADIALAEAEITSATARRDETETEWNRIKDLAGVSGKERTAARAAWEVAKAQLKGAEASLQAAEASRRTARIQLGYTDIKAAISGRISRTLVTPGNLVGQTDSTLLTTIVSQDPLYVYFDAPERDLVEFLRAGAQGVRRVFVGVATEEGFPHAGELDFRENRVETATGTVRVRGRIPNPLLPDPGMSALVGVGGVAAAAGERGRPELGLTAVIGPPLLYGWKDPNTRVLYPGLFARVRVPLGGPVERLVLPEEALLTGQEGRFVYVIGPENKVVKRTVKVGSTVWRAPPPADPAPRWRLVPPDGAKPSSQPPALRTIVAIEDGLTAGDRVVVVGLQRARPGAPVTPDEWRLVPPAK